MVTQTPAEDDSGSAAFTRGRFPRNSLKESLKLVKAVQDLGQGVAIRRVSAFGEIERSPSSGTSKVLLASVSRGYGLLRVVQQGTYLEPTAEGTALVTAASEQDRRALAWQVMSSNEIFRMFIDRWVNRQLPSDEAVIDVLMQSSSLNEADARTCFKVFMENLGDNGFIEQVGGRRVITVPDNLPGATDGASSEEVSDESGGGSSLVATSGNVSQTSVAQRLATNLTGQIQPQIAFNIQSSYPRTRQQKPIKPSSRISPYICWVELRNRACPTTSWYC